jgi:arginyl-tRNA synthetase
VHVPFGTVLGADKKPLKTRSGENFTLKALLDEAIDRGVREVTARSSDPASPTHGMGAAELHAIGQAVGIAAVKYADLSSEVSRDYVFDLDRMVAFEGDTGPYLQYAHARIASMLAKAGDAAAWTTAPIDPSTPEEKALGFAILRYPVAVRTAADQCSPSTVCAYLYALANAFNAFYQACPVLKCDDAAMRASRLRLAHLARRTLADGLSLLGIEAPARM